METQSLGTSYVLQEHLAGVTPISAVSPQSGVSFQLSPATSVQGAWYPDMQDMWNMMVSMQQSLMQMTEKFIEQQKEMYEQKREMDTLKETNKHLMQKVNAQQGKLDELEKRSTTHEENVKGLLTTPPSWAQVTRRTTNSKINIPGTTPHAEIEKEQDFSHTYAEDIIDADERADRTKRQ